MTTTPAGMRTAEALRGLLDLTGKILNEPLGPEEQKTDKLYRQCCASCAQEWCVQRDVLPSATQMTTTPAGMRTAGALRGLLDLTGKRF